MLNDKESRELNELIDWYNLSPEQQNRVAELINIWSES